MTSGTQTQYVWELLDGARTPEGVPVNLLYLVVDTDGTLGSAVAGLHKCYSQARVNTPKPVWNPDEPNPLDFYEGWEEVPDNMVFDNGFKVQWEDFLRHVAEDAPWSYTMEEGAKGVQLTEAAYQSMRERRWVDLEDLEI